MLLIKLWYHIVSAVQRMFYYAIYGAKLKIGKRTTWRKNFSIMKTSDAIIEIGKECFFNNGCSINANCLIKIGDGTLFGENVKIYDHNHRFNSHIPIKSQGFSNGEVIIGKHCWIGSNVTILKGATISDNCVISSFVPQGCIVKPDNQYHFEKIQYKDEG